jgi:hypothetical protein
MSFLITQFKSLSTQEIFKELKKDVYCKEIFKAVLPYDCLPKAPSYPSAYVVNTDPLGKEGQHWLAFYYDISGKCTFFDSFGHSPAFFGLEAYIEKTSTKWEYNTQQLQSIFSSTCGYYCIYFILLKSRNFKMCDILNLFNKTNFHINDYIVSKIFNE